jgi:CubicO group peptidase (beta-lactamase class C family)
LVTSTPEAAGLRSDEVVLYSPWLTTPARGTYYHAGRWERLDQVLLLPGSGRAMRVSLRVVDDDALTTDDGRPARYDPRTGYGYSDHLPVVVQVSWGGVD